MAVDRRPMSRLMTSAERRLAAISKVVRVRVEFSKKGLKTLLPRNRGTFHLALGNLHERGGRVEDMGDDFLGRPSIEQVGQFAVAIELRVMHAPASRPGCRRRPWREPDSGRPPGRWTRCSTGGDGQFPAAAVNQDGQFHRGGAARSRRVRSRRHGWCGRYRTSSTRMGGGCPRPKGMTVSDLGMQPAFPQNRRGRRRRR